MQGWTLNYEMFFYMIMAICIIFVKKRNYLGIVCAFLLGTIYGILNIINTDIFVLNYYKNSLFPEFISGIILFYLYNYCKKVNSNYFIIKNKKISIFLFGLLAIVSFIYLSISDMHDNLKLTHNRNIYFGIPSFLLVFSVLNFEPMIKINKFTKLCLKLGDASYTLYLFHTIIISFLTRIVFNKILLENRSLFVAIILEVIIMGITLFGSVIIYDIIDAPIQKSIRGFMNKIKSK
jgi:peptidoglycan/LPS O-acetylase OafA/YrhL